MEKANKRQVAKKEKEKIANVQKEAAKKLGGGKDKRSDLQKESDDYTARKVAKAISTGDYSGGFNEGGSHHSPWQSQSANPPAVQQIEWCQRQL